MSKIPISVCIIAKNEENHIEECLKKIKPYGFEVIVTDTGSTDRTKELVIKYADKVLDFAWTQNFSAARNYCAMHASHDWILALDCDEYVSKADIPALRQLICHELNCMATGALQLKNIIIRQDGSQGYARDIVPRFYNRKYFMYEKPVHEQLVPKPFVSIKEPQSFLLPIEAVHYGYALSQEEMRCKQERNLRLLYHQLESEGETPYICFQIGQSELVLKHCDKAIAYYERGLSYGESGSLIYVQQMIEGLAKAYIITGRRKDALVLMEKYEPECDSAKYVFYHANVLMDNKEPLKALVKYVKATMMHDTHMLGDELLYCYQHIIEIYHELGEDELAGIFKEKYAVCLKEREEDEFKQSV